LPSHGELTAGSAIKMENQLNFMNNFSKVNKELLVEMKDEKNKGKIDDAKAIADDVIDSEEYYETNGQGIGLGLCLSYDIVKTHCWEIKVNAKEGKFTEFVIQLPKSA